MVREHQNIGTQVVAVPNPRLCLAVSENLKNKPGGCPRFGVGTWVLGLPSLPFLNIHGKQRLLPAKVIRPATPSPISRMIHQAALYRIGVHVIQLLSLLSPAIHIEIVKPRLPERPQRFTRRRKWQSQLPRARSLPFAQLPCHAWFQFLQHYRGSALPQFADQQMHMLGHYHITDQTKSCCIAYSSQFFHQEVSRPRRFQQRQSLVTTESNKVQIALAVIAFKTRRHRQPQQKKPTPRPRFPPRTWGTLRLSVLSRDVSQ